jgi:hypothetical protein
MVYRQYLFRVGFIENDLWCIDSIFLGLGIYIHSPSLLEPALDHRGKLSRW